MSKIDIIDNYRVRCEKYIWTDEDIINADCLGIIFNNENNSYIIDVRVVSKKATLYFLTMAFPAIISSQQYKVYRDKIFASLKQLYLNVYNDFMVKYYPKTKYTRDLFPHQKETLAFSIHKQHNLWALDMGLGKTITSATLSKVTECRRTVIISPTLVKWNWFEDMTRFWGYNPMYWSIIDSNKSKTIKAFQERFVVLNYEQVKKNMDYLLRDEVNHLIIDECHGYKNPQSLRSKHLAEFLKEIPKARLTMLSGTPITNRINDMFAYLKIAQHPLGKSKAKFEENYTIKVGARGGKIVGAKNIPELKGKISNLMIRLRSEDCLDLPPIIITNYYFEHNELEEYDTELKNLREKKDKYESLEGIEKTKMNTEIKNNIHTLNRLVATSKVPQVKLLIDSIVEQGEKVVVFSGYKNPINALEDIYGSSCVKIDGTIQPHKRQVLINRFIEDDKCKVFLGNMKAAGIGINLVNARHVIMMNFPFSPEQIEQAQKRLHRPGQTGTVNVYYTVAKGTIDEHILDLVSEKAEDINELIDGDNKSIIKYGNLPQMLFKKLLE
jgi:SWI/SNF-related matrix-associated actin-dependent regulator 1 of chromatin subfamily A